MMTPGSAEALAAGLRSTFEKLAIPFTASPDTPQLVVAFETTPALFTAHPGAIGVFVPLVEGVEGGKAEEAADLLSVSAPIDEAWAPLASYRPGDGGEVGLTLMLPMPRTISEPLLADAFELIERTLLQVGIGS